MSPRAGVGSPSPFPLSPTEWALRTIQREPSSGVFPDFVGAIGDWDGDGDDVESAEEVRAATVQPKPSMLSQVIGGEKIQLRPRCEECGSAMLRDDHGASWCPTCISAGIESGDEEQERDQEAGMDARGLAALPVTLSDRVLAAHEQLVLKTHGPELKDEFDIQLGFNPNTGAFDAMMRGDVMQVLHDLGPVVTIKGRIHF